MIALFNKDGLYYESTIKQSSTPLISGFSAVSKARVNTRVYNLKQTNAPSSPVFSVQISSTCLGEKCKKTGKYRVILLPVYLSWFMEPAIQLLLQLEIVTRFVFKNTQLHHHFEHFICIDLTTSYRN